MAIWIYCISTPLRDGSDFNFEKLKSLAGRAFIHHVGGMSKGAGGGGAMIIVTNKGIYVITCITII